MTQIYYSNGSHYGNKLDTSINMVTKYNLICNKLRANMVTNKGTNIPFEMSANMVTNKI